MKRLNLSQEKLLDVIELQSAIVRARPDLKSVMETVVEHARSLTDADGAVVELVEGEELVYRAGTRLGSNCLDVHLKLNASLSGHCVTENEVLLCYDSETDPRCDRAACRQIGMRSAVVVPLVHDAKPVGVLKVLYAEPHGFSSDDATTLTLLADVIAASMHRAREHQAALHMIEHDALTGLPNRRAFEKRLRDEVLRHQRFHTPVSIAFVDLDGFKQVNDTYGHADGDMALKDFAAAMKRTLRALDGCFRFGGDEFAIIMPGTRGNEALRAVERVREACAAAAVGHGIVGVSAGVVEVNDDESDAAIVARADALLYEEKRRKKAARRTGRTLSVAAIEAALGGAAAVAA